MFRSRTAPPPLDDDPYQRAREAYMRRLSGSSAQISDPCQTRGYLYRGARYILLI